MKQYQDLLQRILDEGCEKESGRPNMPYVWGIEDGEIKMDLRKGFPLLTTKKMYWKGVIHELLWFLRGETNIKYLVDNNVNIWNGDAYRWHQKICEESKMIEPMSMEGFIRRIKNDHLSVPIRDYKLGDLGKVYGYQWRNQNGVDQIKDLIEGLKANPYSRYHIVDGWNKADFNEMALPPCHLLYQFIVRPLSLEERDEIANMPNNVKLGNAGFEMLEIPKFYLNLNMYQRSCDTFLGVPFNLASMSLFLMIVAKTCNMIPRQAKWLGGDVHIYMDHIPVVKEQLEREPLPLPKMIIKKDLNSLDDIMSLTIDDFELIDYQSHPGLKGELFTGYNK